MNTKLLLAASFLAALVGCAGPQASPAKADQPIAQGAAATGKRNLEQGKDDNSIHQMAPNVGGITPVAGAESLDGSSSAGGIGAVAKKQALKAAASEGQQPSPPTEGSN